MRLSEFIETEIEPILSEWDAFAVTLLPAARGLPVDELRDDARALLLHIAADMRTVQSEDDRRGKSHGLRSGNSPGVTDASHSHAQERFARGFTLDQMVSEYRALRASVVRLWTDGMDRVDGATLEELIRFGEAMDQALAESIGWYSAKVEEARSLLLGVLGHDLRNPLGAARTCAIHLLRTKTLDVPQTQSATRILNSTTRMRQMVNDLLDFTATRGGTRLPITPLHTNMATVCRQVIDETSALYPNCELQLELEVGGDDYVGLWSAERVSQMLTNLVANALQHGQTDSPVTLTVRGNQESVEVDVHNFGAPIAEDERRTLFEPLLRLSGQVAERLGGSSGLGLGLYVAQQIAVAHGGRLALKRSDISGTTFTVRLPRKAPAYPPARAGCLGCMHIRADRVDDVTHFVCLRDGQRRERAEAPTGCASWERGLGAV